MSFAVITCWYLDTDRWYKHIRNNLIHGEKLQNDDVNVERNQALLECAKRILVGAMEQSKDEENRTVLSYFNDIPNF
jgi:hypothetical protein